GQTLGTALLPLQQMISKIFGIKAPGSENIGATQAASLAKIGTEMALIFALGFLINILMARLTRFKFVHLSPHVSFFFAG
ncbi:SgaT protein, partial [Lacticaseibacillus rhamnosus MTCC 5462]